MGVYDNDPRVERMVGDVYLIPDTSSGVWGVRREGGRWGAYDQYGLFSTAVGWCDTADEAIKAIIGEPDVSRRFVLNVHPDDAHLWKQMTGRDETRPDDMPPIKTRESLDYMLASAQRNGVRITGWRDLGEGER